MDGANMDNSMEALEEMQFNIEQQLRKCTAEEIAEVMAGLQITAADGESARQMLRKVCDKLDDSTDYEAKSKMLLSLVPLVPSRMASEVMSILIGKKARKEDDSDFNRSVQDVSQVLQAMGFEAGATNSALRREFKIVGTIGAPNNKERVTYMNLCSQIEDARSKNYSDKEICQALRKAVSPGTELRTVLDAKVDMTLETMLTFVRGYLQEKTATELYHELNSMSQKDDEDPQTFVLRAMGVRERIVKASASDSSGIHYDTKMIQSLFLHTIRTGLNDIAVKSEVKELLRDDETLDEEILSALNTAALEEHQRKAKTETVAKKRVAINEASIRDSRTAGASVSAIDELMSPLLDTMKVMKEELKSLRHDVNSMHTQRGGGRGGGRGRGRGGRRACEHCQRDNTGANCKHCWICGAGDHKSFDCTKLSNN